MMKSKNLLGFLAMGVLILLAIYGTPYLDKPVKKKPQEPAPPFPYYTEEVTFKNEKDNITLAGTLSLPDKNGHFPVVILISGSGAQDRDCLILGHKPFLVLTDDLTKKGIGVLRFDDRGFGKSTGDFKSATSQDFATDVESAINYLKQRPEINAQKIGLIGHSEGGIVAPMVAAQSKDVDFIVLLAAPGIPIDTLLAMQIELISRSDKMPEAQIQKLINTYYKLTKTIQTTADLSSVHNELVQYAKDMYQLIPKTMMVKDITEENYVSVSIAEYTSPWNQFILNYDPAKTLKKVHCPVLALNGELDLQVPPKENLKSISEALALGGNTSITIKELPQLNHFFQESKTGAPSEYQSIEQTFSPKALEEISTWVLEQVK